MSIDEKLRSLGITLPETNFPSGNYVSYKVIDNMVYVSGQTPRIDGKVAFSGRLGKDFSVYDGKEAAKVCLHNVLCQIKHACGGDLSRVKSVVKINVFIQAVEGFSAHAQVADGASDLLVEVFGDKGRHVRTSTGLSSLPSNSAVEIDAIFCLETQ